MKSQSAQNARGSVAKRVATLIRDERWPRRHEKVALDDAVDQAEGPDEQVIWSPFRLQRRRHTRATLASLRHNRQTMMPTFLG